MDWFYVGMIASMLTAIQLIPQAIATFRSKSLKGISLTTFIIVSISATLWLAYGLSLGDIPIIFANSIALICSLLIVSKKMRKKK